MVRMLLGRPDVDLNFRDKDGRTPLSHAAAGGSEKAADTIATLLDSGRVYPESRDNEGFSPLFRAISKLDEGRRRDVGPRRIIKLLLAGEAVSLMFKVKTVWKLEKIYKENSDHTLVWVVKQQYVDILRLMLEKRQANHNTESRPQHGGRRWGVAALARYDERKRGRCFSRSKDLR